MLQEESARLFSLAYSISSHMLVDSQSCDLSLDFSFTIAIADNIQVSSSPLCQLSFPTALPSHQPPPPSSKISNRCFRFPTAKSWQPIAKWLPSYFGACLLAPSHCVPPAAPTKFRPTIQISWKITCAQRQTTPKLCATCSTIDIKLVPHDSLSQRSVLNY